MSKDDINDKNKNSEDENELDSFFEESDTEIDEIDPMSLFDDDEDENENSKEDINNEIDELFGDDDDLESDIDDSKEDSESDFEDDNTDEITNDSGDFDESEKELESENSDELDDIFSESNDDTDSDDDDIFDTGDSDGDEDSDDAKSLEDQIFGEDEDNDDVDDIFSESDGDSDNELDEDIFNEKESDDEDDIFGNSSSDSEDFDEDEDVFGDSSDDNDGEDDIFGDSNEDEDDDYSSSVLDNEKDSFNVSDRDTDTDGEQEDDLDFSNKYDNSDEIKELSGDGDEEFVDFDSNIKDGSDEKETKSKPASIMSKLFNKAKKEVKEVKDTRKESQPKGESETDSISAIMSGKGSKKKTKTHKHEKVRKTSNGGNPWVLVGSSVVLTTLTISISSILLKDQISDIFFMEQDIRISTLESSINREINNMSGDLDDLKASSERTYLKESDFDNRFEMAQYEQTMNIQEIEQDLNRSLSNINEIDGRLTRLLSRVDNQGDVNNQIESAINLISSEMDDQKRLISRTVQTTLDVIQQSREMESRLNDDIYERISSQVRDDMRRQRQELYDFSVIEDRLTTALNRISELTREVNSQQNQNDRLHSEINELRNIITDVSEGQVELSQVRESQEVEQAQSRNLVIEELTRNDDNTISIERNREPNEVNRGSEGQSNLPRYDVIALLENSFYIRNKDEKFEVFEIGDVFYEYGRILRIENNNIITEKGLVRKQ